MKDNENTLKSLYTTIFAQKYSHDGNELAVSDNFGHIAVYKYCSALFFSSKTKSYLLF